MAGTVAGHQGPGVGHQGPGAGHHTLTAAPGLSLSPLPSAPGCLCTTPAGSRALPRARCEAARPPAPPGCRQPPPDPGRARSELRGNGESRGAVPVPVPVPRGAVCLRRAGGVWCGGANVGARRSPCGAQGGQRQLLTGRVYSRRRCHLVSEKD